MPSPVTHFEIHGKDGKQTQAFYSSLFDWQIDANNPMNYGMVPGSDGGIGGGVTGSESPMVTFYVQVADLKASLKKAERLGGKTIMEPMDVPGGPSIAMFQDPDGNQIGLLKG